MRLSVVAVNENKCKLLRQALISVMTTATDYEIIIFDNASTDESVAMLTSDFPDVKLLTADKKLTYTRAANKALAIAKGDYVLLMDPAVFLSDDTLKKTIDFMNTHPISGAVSVRMINSAGRFLPESKNGIPTVWINFFKYLFLFRFFPKLRLNKSRSHNSWTEEFETSEIDVVSRTFSLFRKSALSEVGLFDERFAMYGQDVDLSYRIRLAGYKNYYYAKTHIINYNDKGINKFNWHYIKSFYGAMITFAAKYLFKMPALSLEAGKPVSASMYEFER